MRRRWQRPWLGSDDTRRRFEGDARHRYPTLRAQRDRIGCRYTLMVPVPGYKISRHVRIRFIGETPLVHVVGPKASPHRYSDSSLCMWFPEDPVEARWTVEDGLVELINCIALHLFREEWWRETGEWVGAEAPHATVTS